MKEPKTKITLENQYGTFTVETKEHEITLVEVFENLIIPVLLSAGYHNESIKDYLK